MTMIELLESYKKLKIDAERLKVVYNQLNDTIACRGGYQDGQPRGSGISHPTESDAIRLAEAFTDYAEALNKATRRMLKIEKLIRTVPDWRGRHVLSEHYLKFRPIDEIGEDELISRCGRQARRYHDDAIDYLNERAKYAISNKGK